MPRSASVARMCSSTLSVNCEYVAETNAKSNPTAVPLISQRSHVGNLRQTLPKRVGVKRVETLVSTLLPRRGYGAPAAGAALLRRSGGALLAESSGTNQRLAAMIERGNP